MDKHPFVTVGELADYLDCPVIGNKNKKLYGLSLYRESTEDTLAYIPSNKIDVIKDIHAGAILTRSSFGLQLHRNYIITREDPYLRLADAVSFFIDKGCYCTCGKEEPKISKTARVVQFVAVGKGSEVGDDTTLLSGVILGENVRIGSNCTIGPNTVIGDNTIIEDHVIIGSCCSIGTENFEFCKNGNRWVKIPTVGNVLIHHNVYIGGNVVIEKGTIGTTEIGAYTQIENLVQIGHEVRIGEHSHIVACAAIAGWADIGSHVDIYGQAAVGNAVKVRDYAVLLARSGVDKPVNEGKIVSGFPAQSHHTEMRFQAFLRKLYRRNMEGRK